MNRIDEGLDCRAWAVLKLHADLPLRLSQTLDHLQATDGTASMSDATRILVNEEAMLKQAEVFAWEPDIVRAVKESALTIQRDIPFHEDWLFAEAGFWFFGTDSPFWGLSTIGYPVNPIPRRICAISYLKRPEDVIYEAYTLDHHEPTSGPVPIFGARWMRGTTLDQQMKSLDVFAPDTASIQDVDVFRKYWPQYRFKEGAEVPELWKVFGGECPVYTPKDLVDFNHTCYRTTAEAVGRFFLAANLWLQQKLLVGTPHQPSRGARRRAEREGHSPLVKVITLRRTQHEQRPADAQSGREFDCQWIVRGHWHHYWQGGILTPKWLEPYVKGPEGKPLRVPKGTVFRVNR